MITREQLSNCDEREILIQLRMAVAVLEERTGCLPTISDRLHKLEGEHSWIKKVVFTGTPLGPILAGISALVIKLLG